MKHAFSRSLLERAFLYLILIDRWREFARHYKEMNNVHSNRELSYESFIIF